MATVNTLGAGSHPSSISINNKFVNPDFDIWQRGTSFISPSTSAFSADRMIYSKAGAMVHDITRSTDVPTVSQSNHLSNYSIFLNVTTADASIAAADESFIGQNIEGYDFRDLAQREFTLSFWVKGTQTGTHCVAFRNDGLGGTPDRSFVAEYEVNTTNTWEYKTVTVTPSPSSGSWSYTTLRGIRVTWCLAVGSDFQTTAGLWQTGNFLGTSNQINTTSTTNNEFRLAQIQLETGTTATQFRNRSFSDEVRLCQRYYEKSYDIDVSPGTVTDTGREFFRVISANGIRNLIFKVMKRDNGTMTFYNPATGGSGTWRNLNGNTNITITAFDTGHRSASCDVPGSADDPIIGHWVVIADI